MKITISDQVSRFIWKKWEKRLHGFSRYLLSANLLEDSSSGSVFEYFTYTQLLREVWRYLDVEYYDQVMVHNFQAKFTFFKWITNYLISSYVYSYERMPCNKPDRETKISVISLYKSLHKKGWLSAPCTDVWLWTMYSSFLLRKWSPISLQHRINCC